MLIDRMSRSQSIEEEAEMPAPEPWDLVVVGAGSAGLVASKTAAGFGARVLLAERDRLGGDCLWTGCVPSKTLIAAANHTETIAFAAVMDSVAAAIAVIAPTDSKESLERDNVTVRLGEAHFTSPRTLTVNGEQIVFRQAIVATGTTPAMPAIEGIDDVSVLTSDSFWDLRELPPRLAIIGGGAIACELGQAMARLGSHVTIVQHGSRLLPKEQPEASTIVKTALEADGVRILTGRTAAHVRSADGLSGELALDDGTVVGFDRMLVAVGRRPRNDSLGLTAAGVRLDSAGYIEIDDSLRTTNPRIWAAGDATGLPQFTHIAGVNGSIAATNAMLGLRRRIDRRVVPRVTFTSPEVAAVGLQASDANARLHRVVTIEHRHSDRAVAESRTIGFTQIVVARNGRMLGGTIIGPRAGETVGELSLAVKLKLSTSSVAATTHPYPTFSDPLWNAAVQDVRFRLNRGAIKVVIRVLRWLRSLALTAS